MESIVRVAELREVLAKYDQQMLNDIIAELYKSIPKKVKEEKEIDLLLSDYGKFKEAKKTNLEIPVDFKALTEEILQFAVYAEAQYYFAPNRYVPKKERSKWRFKVKKYIKALVGVKGEQAEVAVNLLILLYRMLSYGCAYWIFSTASPFASVGYGQGDLLEIVLKKNFHYGVTRKNLMKAVALVVENHSDPMTLSIGLQWVLISCLKTNEAMSLAMEVAEDYLRIGPGKGFSDDFFKEQMSEYRRKEVKERTVSLIFHLKMALYEFDDAIRFYWSQNTSRSEREREIALYILLSYLESHERFDLWVSEYENAVRKKIRPRETLAKQYALLKEGDFPAV
jgi:hypothetical protein